MQTNCSDGYTISDEKVQAGRKLRRRIIERAKREHGTVTVQDSYHGAGRYSVQVIAAGKVVADQDLS